MSRHKYTTLKFISASLMLILGSKMAVASQNMQIKISNDTNDVIYPLITANNQQCVKNGISIPAGQSYTFNLSSNCWNAGRVYLAKEAFSISGDQPIAGKYQLAEYTFTNNGSVAVDYDFSAVDSLFTLPIAIEPINPIKPDIPKYGYTGMSQKQTEAVLQEEINQFTQATSWPTFSNAQNKIPGGYNLFALTSDIDINQGQASVVRNNIIKKWYDWHDKSSMCSNSERSKKACNAFQKSVIDVINAFEKNAAANGAVFKNFQDKQYQIIQHIIGYVPFGSWDFITDNTSDKVIGLLRGVSRKSQEKQEQQYLFPDYNSQYSLDPYVTFIHKIAKLNVYAFSIDDAVGNYDVPNYNGIQIDVGGVKSLVNQYPQE